MGRTSYGEIELRASRKRTLTAAILIFTLMPATIAVSTLCFGGARYMITSLLIIIYTMVPFFMIFLILKLGIFHFFAISNNCS